MCLLTPSEIGYGPVRIERPELSKTQKCSKCETEFDLDDAMHQIISKEQMVVEAIVCLQCLNKLTWSGDDRYPVSVADFC